MPFDQLCPEQKRADARMVQQARQSVISAAAQRILVLPDRCKRRYRTGGKRRIVKSDHADFFRYPDPGFHAVNQNGARQLVVFAQNGGYSVF